MPPCFHQRFVSGFTQHSYVCWWISAPWTAASSCSSALSVGESKNNFWDFLDYTNEKCPLQCRPVPRHPVRSASMIFTIESQVNTVFVYLIALKVNSLLSVCGIVPFVWSISIVKLINSSQIFKIWTQQFYL